MQREDVKRLVQGLFGRQQEYVPDLDEPGNVLPLRLMIEQLIRFSDIDFGFYAWSREPLERKFDSEQKMRYILKAGACGRDEVRLLMQEYQTGEPELIAAHLGLKVQEPSVPTGGGHVIFAQYVEPDEITIFADAVTRGERLIAEHDLGDLLAVTDVKRLLLAHEIFHAVEYRKADSIYTRTEKVELFKKPFSNKSGLICLGEIAAMAFAAELTGVSYSPYLLDVLLMYGYHEAAATALYEEMMEIAGKTAENEEVFNVNKQYHSCG